MIEKFEAFIEEHQCRISTIILISSLVLGVVFGIMFFQLIVMECLE